MSSRITRTASSDCPLGSATGQSSLSIPGMMGQASSQPIVTSMSAPRASSSVSNCGRADERSMPTSFIAVITSPCTRFAGWVPADIACAAVGSERALNHAAAICERPALCTQAKRTAFIRAHFPYVDVEPAPARRLRESSERASETQTWRLTLPQFARLQTAAHPRV